MVVGTALRAYKGDVMVLSIATRLLFVLAFLCCSASEQESTGLAKLDLFLGYSYGHVSSTTTTGLRTQNLNGADTSDSYQLKPWLHVVADFGLASAGDRASGIIGIRVRGTQTTFLLGPRVVLPMGRTAPFAEVLFAVAHASAWLFDTSSKQTDFAWAFGGGFDYRLTTHLALRPLQLEFLRTNVFEFQDGKLTQNDFRVSTGIVFRF
jgi:hypothetical protein